MRTGGRERPVGRRWRWSLGDPKRPAPALPKSTGIPAGCSARNLLVRRPSSARLRPTYRTGGRSPNRPLDLNSPVFVRSRFPPVFNILMSIHDLLGRRSGGQDRTILPEFGGIRLTLAVEERIKKTGIILYLVPRLGRDYPPTRKPKTKYPSKEPESTPTNDIRLRVLITSLNTANYC